MNSVDWKNATPEQKNLWKYASSLIAYTTITPLFYNGPLVGSEFSVYNAGNNCICLDYESECFLLWFCGLDKISKDTWDQKNKFQKAVITATDHEQMSERRHSPAMLHNRIEKLEENVKAIISVGGVIIFPLLIAVGVTTFQHWFLEKTDRVGTITLIVGTSLITSLFLVALLSIYVFFRRWFKKGKI